MTGKIANVKEEEEGPPVCVYSSWGISWRMCPEYLHWCCGIGSPPGSDEYVAHYGDNLANLYAWQNVIDFLEEEGNLMRFSEKGPHIHGTATAFIRAMVEEWKFQLGFLNEKKNPRRAYMFIEFVLYGGFGGSVFFHPDSIKMWETWADWADDPAAQAEGVRILDHDAREAEDAEKKKKQKYGQPKPKIILPAGKYRAYSVKALQGSLFKSTLLNAIGHAEHLKKYKDVPEHKRPPNPFKAADGEVFNTIQYAEPVGAIGRYVFGVVRAIADQRPEFKVLMTMYSEISRS